MKNKGYTLLELLGVIVILSLLVTLVFPSVINFIKKGNDKIDNVTNDLIVSAAEAYINDNSSKLYITSGIEQCVPVDILIGKKYLGKSLIDEELFVTKSIKITYTDKYNYELTNTNTCAALEAGLYDENGAFVATWEELINAGLDVEKDTTSASLQNLEVLSSFAEEYKLSIDGSVTRIGDYAFNNCEGLISIIIPNSIESIGDYAFSSCANLTSIKIPRNVNSIGSRIFGNINPMTSIIVDDENSVYDSRENSNAIIEKASNTLIVGCKNTVIPNSVTSIADNAFYGCRGMTTIIIPNSIKSIGDYAFYGSTNLENINISSNVISIGSRVFGNCSKLSSITVDTENSVYDSRENSNAIIEKVSNTLIVGCKNTIIPNSVVSIGSYAFGGSSALKNISIPDSVISIENSAFYYCGNLTTINISNSVTSIGSNVFDKCSRLTTIYYSGIAEGSPWGAPNATVISE